MVPSSPVVLVTHARRREAHAGEFCAVGRRSRGVRGPRGVRRMRVGLVKVSSTFTASPFVNVQVLFNRGRREKGTHVSDPHASRRHLRGSGGALPRACRSRTCSPARTDARTVRESLAARPGRRLRRRSARTGCGPRTARSTRHSRTAISARAASTPCPSMRRKAECWHSLSLRPSAGACA